MVGRQAREGRPWRQAGPDSAVGRGLQDCCVRACRTGSTAHTVPPSSAGTPGQGLTPLEQTLHQALPRGQAAGVVGGHAPQQRLSEATLHSLGLLGSQGIQLSLDGGPLCTG